VGPSGRNIFNRQDDQKDTHLHVGCWRLEFDLGDPISGVGGPKNNEVLLVRRIFDEATERFGLVAKPFAKNVQGEACEGSARWNAEEFTVLRVQSSVRKNGHSRPVAFDLLPQQRQGALRQLRALGGAHAANMDFINQDFWVTRTESGFTDYIDVPRYASQHRPLSGQATTVWHCTPALHVPRGEDFGSEDGKNSFTGLAVTNWTGFTVKPRDLFDSTPLYRARPLQRR
jgi:Cu2+-containing amine oxidase